MSERSLASEDTLKHRVDSISIPASFAIIDTERKHGFYVQIYMDAHANGCRKIV